jgi:hypothetical protein
MKPLDPEYCFVLTKTRTSCVPGEPNDYIVRFKSELRRYVDEDEGDVGDVADDEVDPSVRVATLGWSVLNFTGAANDGVALFDVMDADSEEMLWVLETISSDETPGDVEGLVFEGWGSVIYFRDFDVASEHDLRVVARTFIDHVLRFHGSGVGAVFIFGVDDKPEVRDAFMDCGFELVRRLDDMEFYTLDLALKRPEPADRTNVRPLKRRKPVRED